MELNLQKGGYLRDFQKAFNEVYPYLKIEFYKPSQELQESNLQKHIKHNSLILVNGTEKFKESGQINIDNFRTSAQLEKDFLDNFGLAIKLFRKSGSLWIEITLTDNWTLEKQNEEGEFMSLPDIRRKALNNDTEIN